MAVTGTNGCAAGETPAAFYRRILRAATAERHEANFAEFLRLMQYPAPLTEYRFSVARDFRADFAWPSVKLIVETEGGIWRRGGGAHSRPAAIERDIEKYNHAVALGWRVIRVTDKMLARKRWPQLDLLLRPFFI